MESKSSGKQVYIRLLQLAAAILSFSLAIPAAVRFPRRWSIYDDEDIKKAKAAFIVQSVFSILSAAFAIVDISIKLKHVKGTTGKKDKFKMSLLRSWKNVVPLVLDVVFLVAFIAHFISEWVVSGYLNILCATANAVCFGLIFIHLHAAIPPVLKHLRTMLRRSPSTTHCPNCHYHITLNDNSEDSAFDQPVCHRVPAPDINKRPVISVHGASPPTTPQISGSDENCAGREREGPYRDSLDDVEAAEDARLLGNVNE